MIKLEDIHSLTDFQRDTKTHIKTLKKTGRPAVLTVNGKATLIVQDASAYQSMLDSVERAEAIAGIHRGLDSVSQGVGGPAAEVFQRIGRKRKIPAE